MLIAAVCLSTTTLSAKGLEEYTKTVSKEFTVTSDTHIAFKNKFGKVHVTTGSGNKVTIEVVVKVDAKSQEKGQKLLDGIEIQFEESAKMLMAETEFKFSNKEKSKILQVDYKVTMPAANQLSIRNKFGDVYVSDLSGKFALDLSYGNVKCDNLKGDGNTIDMSFSQGHIAAMGTAEVDLSYSELEVDKASSLNVDSEFSEFKIGGATDANIDSQYDTYKINNIGKLNADWQFSTVEIGSLSGELVVDSQYGAIEVGNVSKGFSRINIDSQFGDVKIIFESGAGYKLSAQVSMGGLNYPKSGSEVKVTEKNHTNMSYAGTVGGGGAASVELDTQYGHISLK